MGREWAVCPICAKSEVERWRVRSAGNLEDLLESWDWMKKRMTMESNANVCHKLQVKRYRSILEAARGTTVHDVIRLRDKVRRLQDTNAQLISALNQVRAELSERETESSAPSSSGN